MSEDRMLYRCPSCGEQLHFKTWEGQYGGLEYKFSCQQCGLAYGYGHKDAFQAVREFWREVPEGMVLAGIKFSIEALTEQIKELKDALSRSSSHA